MLAALYIGAEKLFGNYVVFEQNDRTRAAWERFEFLMKRVGDSRSFHFPSRVFNYALLFLSIPLCHKNLASYLKYEATVREFLIAPTLPGVYRATIGGERACNVRSRF